MKRFVNLETSLSWEVIYFLVNFEMLCNYIHLALNKGDDQMKLLVLFMGSITKMLSSLSVFFFSNNYIFIFCPSQAIQPPCVASESVYTQ